MPVLSRVCLWEAPSETQGVLGAGISNSEGLQQLEPQSSSLDFKAKSKLTITCQTGTRKWTDKKGNPLTCPLWHRRPGFQLQILNSVKLHGGQSASSERWLFPASYVILANSRYPFGPVFLMCNLGDPCLLRLKQNVCRLGQVIGAR